MRCLRVNPHASFRHRTQRPRQQPSQVVLTNFSRNFSMKARGNVQNFAHYRSKERLGKDQRYCHSCPGATVRSEKTPPQWKRTPNRKGEISVISVRPWTGTQMASCWAKWDPVDQHWFVFECDLKCAGYVAQQVAGRRRLPGTSVRKLDLLWHALHPRHHTGLCPNFNWESFCLFCVMIGMYHWLFGHLIAEIHQSGFLSLHLTHCEPRTIVYLNFSLDEQLVRLCFGCYDRLCQRLVHNVQQHCNCDVPLHWRCTTCLFDWLSPPVCEIGRPAAGRRALCCGPSFDGCQWTCQRRAHSQNQRSWS